jgi:hypothetical protein
VLEELKEVAMSMFILCCFLSSRSIASSYQSWLRATGISLPLCMWLHVEEDKAELQIYVVDRAECGTEYFVEYKEVL